MSITRAEILASYTVNHGYIRSPGKFEGEPVWAPYLWERVLDGDGEDVSADAAEDSDSGATLIVVTDEDRQEFPELCGIDRVMMWERSDGFVCTGEVEKLAPSAPGPTPPAPATPAPEFELETRVGQDDIAIRPSASAGSGLVYFALNGEVICLREQEARDVAKALIESANWILRT